MSVPTASLLGVYRRLSAPDRRDLLRAFATLVLALAAHTVLETARDAAFLAELPTSWLPVAYVAVAIATAVTTRLTPDRAPSWALATTFAVAAAGTIGFWQWLEVGGATRTALLALYVWPGVMTTTLMVQFWLRLHRRLDVEEAKALYGFIGGGGLIGALLGALAATAVSEVWGTQGLLLLAPALYLAGVPTALWKGDAASTTPEDDDDDEQSDVENGLADRYVVGLVALAATMTLATTFADFVFKSNLAATVSKEELAEALALFHATVNGIAVTAQFVLLPWLLRRSLRRAIQLLPALLTVAGGAALVAPGLGTALATQGVSSSLKHSVFATASEVLYLPLRGPRRARAKRWVAALGQRGGQALASGMLLIVIFTTEAPRLFAALIVLSSAAATLLVVGLHRGYLARFRARLRERLFLPERPPLPDLDVASLESLVAALSSGNESEVLAALDMLELYEKTDLVPPLILHHPAEAVVLRALTLITRHHPERVEPLVDALMARRSPRVRAAALRTACALGPEHARSAIEATDPDDDHEVAVTRKLATFTAEAFDSGMGRREVQGLLAGTTDDRAILARSLHLLPSSRRVEVGAVLAGSSDESIRRELASTLEAYGAEREIRILLQLLGPDDTREQARRTLLRLPRPPVLKALEVAITSTETRDDIRRHLPRTIMRFGAASAAPLLSRHLDAERDERVVLKILRGLGRIRADHSRAPVHTATLRRLLQQTVARGLRHRGQLRLLRRAVRARPDIDSSAGTLLRSLLDHRVQRETERVFRLLHILFPRSEMNVIHACTRDDDQAVRAAARELLRHSLQRDIRHDVVALVGDTGGALRDRGPWEQLDETLLDGLGIDLYVSCVRTLEDDEDPIVRQVARAHADQVDDVPADSGPRPRFTVVVDNLDLESFDESARTIISGTNE